MRARKDLGAVCPSAGPRLRPCSSSPFLPRVKVPQAVMRAQALSKVFKGTESGTGQGEKRAL